jgi:acetyl esterase/lipase
VKRRWPLVSASYRLLPQVGGEGLLEDATAAYRFARSWKFGGRDSSVERQVIAAGSSAGFFLATLIAHHLTPKPLALLSASGIPTFRHPFFTSPTLPSLEPIADRDIDRLVAEPVSVGTSPSSVFLTDMLLNSGLKNPEYRPHGAAELDTERRVTNRGMLYIHYLQRNLFMPLVGGVDPGFEWASNPAAKAKLADWPFTILLQGDHDEDVDWGVCDSVAKSLGPAKAKIFIAAGQGHRFGRESFLEDNDPGMDQVLSAVKELDRAVSNAMAR